MITAEDIQQALENAGELPGYAGEGHTVNEWKDLIRRQDRVVSAWLRQGLADGTVRRVVTSRPNILGHVCKVTLFEYVGKLEKSKPVKGKRK